MIEVNNCKLIICALIIASILIITLFLNWYANYQTNKEVARQQVDQVEKCKIDRYEKSEIIMNDKYVVIDREEPHGYSVAENGIPCTAGYCAILLNRLSQENEELTKKIQALKGKIDDSNRDSMIIECSKRPDGWMPVKGNEEKICKFLLKHDYYEEYSVDKDGNDFDFDVDIFGAGKHFNNRDGYFVKLHDYGSISVSQKQPSSLGNYVAMEFNLTDNFDWVNWLFNATNVKSITKNLMTNFSVKDWNIKPACFQIQEGSILIFDKDSKKLYNVLDRTSAAPIKDVLLENGYQPI